jgi:hypothetical protein
MPRPDTVELHRILGPDARPCRRALTGETGVALPPLIDHHVHLHLIDERHLGPGGIAGVLDLGGDPIALAQREPESMPRVAYAGAFLTALGGYPGGRSWAPPATVREVTDPSEHPGVSGGAATAVDEQAAFGATVIKVALNADAGPVPDPAILAAILHAAQAHSLPVVAHVEGAGMARLAIEAGIAALAHTPFSELIDPALLARAVEAGQRWISTLDIHRADAEAARIAEANLAAFVRAGGGVLYGTDLGNGDLPAGVNERELAALHSAGIRGKHLLATMTDPWPRSERSHGVSTFVAGEPPTDIDGAAAWLARATVVPTEELIHDDHS